MPSASAASVPIRGATCQSAWAAVRLRRGSITTSCAPPRARLLDLGPRVDRRRDEVGAPGDDQVRVDHGLGVGAAHRTARRLPRDVGARVADRPGLEPRRAEGVEQGHGDPAVELPLVRAVAVAEDRERPVLTTDAPASVSRARRAPRPSSPAGTRRLPSAPSGGAASARGPASARSSGSRRTFAHTKPAVNGWSGSPSTRTRRPSSTWARMEHMSGQS